MEAFYISRQGYQEGPHSLELIEEKIKSGYFDHRDYLYDHKDHKWVKLFRYHKTRDFFANGEELRDLTDSMPIMSPKDQWYLLRGDNQMGPFEFHQVVSLLQDKKAFEYDYVWTPSMKAWERISDCADFKPQRIAPFLNHRKVDSPFMFRRSAARITMGSSLIIHNQKKLWNGSGFQLSSIGATIFVDGANVQTGDMVVVHFRPSKKVPAFNVHCEAVSLQSAETRGDQSKVRIGLKFIRVNGAVKSVLKGLVKRIAA